MMQRRKRGQGLTYLDSEIFSMQRNVTEKPKLTISMQKTRSHHESGLSLIKGP